MVAIPLGAEGPAAAEEVADDVADGAASPLRGGGCLRNGEDRRRLLLGLRGDTSELLNSAKAASTALRVIQMEHSNDLGRLSHSLTAQPPQVFCPDSFT
jgi:hypothetical protein